MIIKDIQLTNFGKFNHKYICLEPGLNIIYGENEAGKTTLHTFIRGMLFGIEKQRGKASAKDIYSKYQPWENPGSYQGTMRIESDGVNYRIERNFSRENKSFKVINEDAGIELTEEQITELFSGLDESCYYNTISISQLGSVTDKELETILKNYAANLGSTKSMEINIKDTFEELNSEKRKIISENKIGEEEMILKSIRGAKDELDISEREQHTIIASIEQKKEIAERLDEKKKDLSARDAKRLEELAKQNERKDNLYQEVLSYTAEIEKYSSTLGQIREHKQTLESELKSKGIEDWDTMNILTDKVVNRSNVPIVFIILTMSCIGAAIGFAVGNRELPAMMEHWIRPFVCLCAAAFFGILSIVKYIFNRSRRNKKMKTLKELRLVLDKLDAAKHEEVYAQRQVNSKREALAQAQELIKAEEEKEVSAEDYSEELMEIDSQKRELREAVSKAKWVLEQKKEKDIQLESRIEELNQKIDLINKAKIEISAIEEAKKNIEEIAADIRDSFGRKLNERVSFYMSQITNGKYDNLSIDDRLNISINGKKSLIPASKLSKGTVEQIYMALRLAAADIIFEKDKKPILLDDAFVMYDNKRMGNTMTFMAENMEQVIIFSCHTREKVMADKLRIKHNFIKL